MEFHLDKCSVREWRVSDAESLAMHANNREIWLNLRNSFPHPYTLEDAQQWIAIATQEQLHRHFAIVVNDAAVGGIGLIVGTDVYCRTAEIGYWLSEEYWGQGIVCEAVKAIVKYGFEDLGLLRIWAEVFEGNMGSMRVLEKADFQPEGILRNSVFKDGRVLSSTRFAIVK